MFEEGPRFGISLLNKLRLEDAMGFRNFTRLTSTDFKDLLLIVGGLIMKKDTKFREAIPGSLRLAVTLRFLASGDSFTSLMYTFRISKQAISQMVPEVCEAIISSLKQYVKVCIKHEFQLNDSIYSSFGPPCEYTPHSCIRGNILKKKKSLWPMITHVSY